jgi:hypothetical protein
MTHQSGDHRLSMGLVSPLESNVILSDTRGSPGVPLPPAAFATLPSLGLFSTWCPCVALSLCIVSRDWLYSQRRSSPPLGNVEQSTNSIDDVFFAYAPNDQDVIRSALQPITIESQD